MSSKQEFIRLCEQMTDLPEEKAVRALFFFLGAMQSHYEVCAPQLSVTAAVEMLERAIAYVSSVPSVCSCSTSSGL